jgi:hypothetical protein
LKPILQHLERHTRSHLKEKPYVCWVPGCHRAFSRRDNLKVHCAKTHIIVGARLVEGSNITVATAASRMCLRTMDFEVVAA